MTIINRELSLSPAQIVELKQLARLIEEYKDHLEVSCCVDGCDHPILMVSSHIDSQIEAGITPHISLYQDKDTVLYWYDPEEDDDDDDEDWDQYRNDRQKSE